MHRLRIVYLILIAVLLIPTLGHAQNSTAADWLVVASENGLQAWVNEGSQPISFCNTQGLNSALVMAPNGDHLAYRIANAEGTVAIHLCDGIDRTAYTLPASPNVGLKNPTWSPDSTMVGWLTRAEPAARIDYYTRATRTLTTLETGLRAPEEIYWAANGILLQDTVEFYLYSLTGETLARFPIPASGFRSYLVAKVGSQEILVGVTQDGALFSHPIGNGDWLPLSGILQLTAPEAAQPRLALNYDTVTASWAIVTPSGASQPINFQGASTSLAIGPDGRTLAYIRDGQVFLWRSDLGETRLPLSGTALVWSPLEWQVANR